MRDKILPDNCLGHDFADKVNILIRDHSNPCIQVTFRCLSGALHRHAARAAHRQVLTDGAGRRRASASAREDAGQRGQGDKGDSALGQDGAVGNPDLAAATKGFNKNFKGAVAAAAPSRFKGKPGGTQPSGGAPYELPKGQWCSK
eukprot:327799-Pleurochrysis_carterae.AAC.1